MYGDATGLTLGLNVARAGDVDGDGVEDLALGTPQAADAGSYSGAVFLFAGGSVGALQAHDAMAIALGGQAGDGAGPAVAAAGDVDGDGRGDLLIAAPSVDYGGPDNGVVYLVLASDLL